MHTHAEDSRWGWPKESWPSQSCLKCTHDGLTQILEHPGSPAFLWGGFQALFLCPSGVWRGEGLLEGVRVIQQREQPGQRSVEENEGTHESVSL